MKDRIGNQQHRTYTNWFTELESNVTFRFTDADISVGNENIIKNSIGYIISKTEKIKMLSLPAPTALMIIKIFNVSVHRKTVDSSRQSSEPLHGSVHNALGHSDYLFANEQTTTDKQNRHSRRVHIETVKNSSNACRTHIVLHVHLAAHGHRAFVEFGRHAACEQLQAVLVEKHDVHP